MYSTTSQTLFAKANHQLSSPSLNRTVNVDIYHPTNLLGNERVHLLLVNDGQDLEQMKLENILHELYESWKIDALVVIGIHANADRLQEYGVAHRPDFKKRGANAHLYTKFVIDELIPFVRTATGIAINGKRAFAGFSLGGLTAFDIAWNNPTHFDAVGVFSGSFWWRKKDLKAGYTDNDRILHQMVRESKQKPEIKFWLMTGTQDETADRNHNFIIDSIDDTIDVIKELLQKGYKRPQDIFYYEKVGGKHDVPTWAEALPAFLTWSFSK